jgi:uncharacterized glyoxalase superfamily protein PhnB
VDRHDLSFEARLSIFGGRANGLGSLGLIVDPANAPTIYPYLRYQDADAALTWLVGVFGFTERTAFRDDNEKVLHAELGFGPSVVLIGPARDGETQASLGAGDPRLARHGIYVHVDDVAAHYDHAKKGGADIAVELTEPRPGDMEYYAQDLEGYIWTFGTYRPAMPAPA